MEILFVKKACKAASTCNELIHFLWAVVCLTWVIPEPAVSTVTIPVAIDSFGVR